MRSNPSSGGPIWSVWEAGHAAVGVNKPQSFFTVQPGWTLQTQSPAGSRTSDKLPIRWFQAANNAQTEVQIPGVRSWDLTYSVDQDTATLNVVLVNNFLDPDFASAAWSNSNGDFGQPGYLTPSRGTTTNRWGFFENEWSGILTANALIRSYEGFGPDGMTLAAGLAAGNFVLTGIWMVDDTPIQTGQKFNLTCTNVAKLLVQQSVVEPLVPAGDYPMTRSALYYPQVVTPLVVYGHLAANPNYRILKADRDLNGDGYWLSGTDGGVFSFGLSHFFGSLETLSPAATQTPAAYPNEGVTGISRTSTGAGYYLVIDQGAVYAFGDATYHGGLALGASPAHPVISIDNAPTLDGYWLTCDDGTVYGYGAATNHGAAPPLTAGDRIVDLAATNTGLGYWLVSQNGAVYSFGDAVYYGGITFSLTAGEKIVAITPTITGLGYYLVGKDGGCFTYGDARFFGSVPALSATETFTDVNTVSGSPFISTNSAEFLPGDATAAITGTNIPASTTIQTVISPTEVRLSANCTGTTTPGALATVTFTRTNAGLTLNDPVSDIIVSVDGSGYWLIAEDGGVFSFRSASSHMEFLGSLPGATVNSYPTIGNYCVDETTEILTKRGWLKWDQVVMGDKARSIDPSTGLVGWEEITSMFREHRDCEMILMEGGGHSSLTTPDHKWLTWSKYNDAPVWKTTKNLNYDSLLFRALPPDLSQFPISPYYDDKFVELVAWFWTEGNDPTSGRGGSLSQSEAVNPNYVARIRDCLQSLYGDAGPMNRSPRLTKALIEEVYRLHDAGVNCHQIELKLGVCEEVVAKWFRNGPPNKFGLWTDKMAKNGRLNIFKLSKQVTDEIRQVAPNRVPTMDFLLSLTYEQLELFVNTSIDADGWELKSGLRLFSQVDEQRIKVFEAACSLLGLPTSTTWASSGQYSTTVMHRRTLCPVGAAEQALRKWDSGTHDRRSAVIERQDYSGIIWCPTLKHHNWLARRNGSVYFTGNSDVTQIVADLVSYAGFYLYDGGLTDGVYGVLENTGITVGGDQYMITLDATFFDKQSVITPLTKLRELVGYLAMVDDQGAFCFYEPNYYQSGNYLPDRTHSTEIPIIDEKIQLTDYKLNLPDKDLRSQIIISSEDPDASIPGTVTTTFTPASAGGLRGMVKPAIFVNEALLNADEQLIMAELIALQIEFMSHLGSVTMLGNPLLNVDDQVQILERETSELNIHYVRTHRRTHDKKTGAYESTLTTHYLSPPTGGWAVVKPANSPTGTVTTNRHI